MRMTLTTAALGAALALTLTSAQADLINGNFETGDLSGWTVAGSTGFTGADPFAAHSGGFGAFFGEDAPGSSIQQTIATVAGGVYQVSFWLQLDDSAVPNSFSWEFGGVTQAGSLADANGFNYAHYTALVTATSATSAVTFNFVNQQSYYLLDDVSVTAVPEPSAALLLIAGIGVLALGARRSRSTKR